MRVMTVAQPGGLDKLVLVEREEPVPAAGEVLVRWRATSLNYHDYLVVTGASPAADGLCPMSDGAGEIVALGDGVDQWQVGDKVMSLFFPNWIEGPPSAAKLAAFGGDSVDGCAAEMSCVAAHSLTPVPDGYSYTEAASLPCAALTAWRALMVEGGLQAGDSVLVQGTGGVSIFALQFARAAGASVYASSSSDAKLARLRELGANEVINYRTDENWGNTVAELSGGGVDHVLDVGGNTTLEHSMNAVTVGGDIALIGGLGGFTAEIVLFNAFFKQISFNGLAVGSAEMQRQMVRAINTAGIRPVLDREFELADLAEAFRYQETGQHFGKIGVSY